MATETKARCSAIVYPPGRFSGRPCVIAVTVERDGKPYCRIHDPEAAEARRAARSEKWEREMRIASVRVSDAIEQKRRADAFPELLAALEALVVKDGFVAWDRDDDVCPYCYEDATTQHQADCPMRHARDLIRRLKT